MTLKYVEQAAKGTVASVKRSGFQEEQTLGPFSCGPLVFRQILLFHGTNMLRQTCPGKSSPAHFRINVVWTLDRAAVLE